MLSRIPRAPSMDASSSGEVMAARAALAARPSPMDDPIPMMAVPALTMTIFTSAKSVLISPGHRDEIGDAPHTLHEHLVGHFEGVEHAGLVVGDGEQAVVGDDDEGVDLLLEDLDALLGLHGPAPTLEGEGPGDDADGQGAQTLGDLGHHGRGAGPGPAALAGRDEDHVGALEGLLDVGPVLLGRLAPDLGITPRTQAPGELATDVELEVGVAHEQRLGVGVGRDEFDVAQPRVDHAVDGVDSPSADPDHLDHCQVVPLGWHGRHELPRLRVDRRPAAR